MGIIGTIIIGFIVGLVARFLKPGRDAMGFILTTLLGIGGAFVGRYIGQALNWYGPEDVAGFIMSVIGAIIILILWGLLSKGR